MRVAGSTRCSDADHRSSERFDVPDAAGRASDLAERGQRVGAAEREMQRARRWQSVVRHRLAVPRIGSEFDLRSSAEPVLHAFEIAVEPRQGFLPGGSPSRSASACGELHGQQAIHKRRAQPTDLAERLRQGKLLLGELGKGEREQGDLAGANAERRLGFLVGRSSEVSFRLLFDDSAPRSFPWHAL